MCYYRSSNQTRTYIDGCRPRFFRLNPQHTRIYCVNIPSLNLSQCMRLHGTPPFRQGEGEVRRRRRQGDVVRGGSYMTGTNSDLFTHKSSGSYLNHLVFYIFVEILLTQILRGFNCIFSTEPRVCRAPIVAFALDLQVYFCVGPRYVLNLACV
jgi:hypothetical protein